MTLAASGLTIRRDGRPIIDGSGLRAPAGDFGAVIGPNGAGKSTLLSVLAGLVRPDTGAVEYDGTPLTALSSASLAKRRSYLPQNPRCEWPISVERLVALGLTPTLPAFGRFAASDRERIERALRACDLADRAHQAATSLSGGELARAMLARALVGEPDILIVDEPLTGLDPRHLLDAVRRLRAYAQTGKLVIASLHDLTVASRYATRVVALRDGRVLAAGETAGILTPNLIRAAFDVDARVFAAPHGAYIDYVAL